MATEPFNENSSQNQASNRMPFSAESFRVRCPHCRKLYLVQFGDIQEAKPRFECSQCHERFWLSLPDMDLSSELNGLPLQVKEAPAQLKTRANLRSNLPATDSARDLEPCPKCFKTNEVHARECSHCGVVLFKARALQNLDFEDPLPPHSPGLENAWKKLIEDYGNEALHGDFMRAAQVERNLPYAAAQYGQMNKLMPTDEITLKRIAEVQALGKTLLGSVEEKPGQRRYPRLWQVPLFGAALLIIVGLAVPMFRNVVGVGAAFLFLGIAMQLQMRRRR